jgi:hypothetical protein
MPLPLHTRAATFQHQIKHWTATIFAPYDSIPEALQKIHAFGQQQIHNIL